MMNRFIFFLILFFLFSSLGCKNSKEDLFVFFNKDYFSLYDEKRAVFEYIKKYFLKNFFNVNQIKINKFATLPSELLKITSKKDKGVLFAENFLYYGIVNNKQSFSNKKFKILTYNFEEINQSEKSFPVLNFVPDEKIIGDRVLKFIKKHSRVKNMTDCVIILSNQYSICKNFESYIKGKFKRLTTYTTSGNPILLKDWAVSNKNKYKIMVFFGFELNSVIYELNRDDFKNNVIIEIFTNYGEASVITDFSINIDNQKLIQYGLNSKQTRLFLKDKDSKNKVENLKISNNVLYTKFYINKSRDKLINSIKNQYEKIKSFFKEIEIFRTKLG